MQTYKVEEKILEIAKAREVEILNSQDSAIRSVKKALEGGETEVSKLMEILKDNKEFRLNFSSDDFRAIAKVISQII